MPAIFILLGYTLLTIGLSRLYFHRYAITRPPIGVMNLWDVLLISVGILLTPYLYLMLPLWLVVSLLGVGIYNLLYLVGEPVFPRWTFTALVALVLAGADVAAAWVFGAQGRAFFLVNNSVLVLAVMGLVNLWAQSGLRARDVALLAALLAVYDFIFTTQLTLMADLFGRLSTLPFAPLIAWPVGGTGQWLGLGLGDVILVVVQPLIMEKAFGRRAGTLAAGLNLLAVAGTLCLAVYGYATIFPVMVVLGPLSIGQYYGWLRRYGHERPTWRFAADVANGIF